MQLIVRDGWKPGATTVAAFNRGVQAMGDPHVEVVLTAKFDETVREYTGSTTYTAGRGSGTVGAKTLTTPAGPVIVVNSLASEELGDELLERLLAHETCHVLMYERDEGVTGHRDLVTSQWRWNLLCLGGLAMDELRVERAVGNAGYPPTGSSTDEHLVEVLHVTTLDLLTLLQDPAAADPEQLMWGAIGLLDRLSKVLAYRAAETLRTGEPSNLAGLGALPGQAWNDYLARTWQQRLGIYAELPSAREPVDPAVWQQALLAGVELEHHLLQDIGFVFEDRPTGEFFFMRLNEEKAQERLERAMAQQKSFEAEG